MTPTPIDRPPRIQPELPFGEIDIPKPPDKRTDGWMRVLQVALPTITILGYILMSAFGGMGRNPWFMIPMALSVVASVIFSLYTYQREKQEQARQARKYTARLVELNKAMLASHEQQRRFYTHNYPEVTTAFQLAETAYAEAKTPTHPLRSQAAVGTSHRGWRFWRAAAGHGRAAFDGGLFGAGRRPLHGRPTVARSHETGR
ncbi:MAG: hypothetical protein IPM07_07390 [Anaerolineales bacterium]|nr:hypothetical protein [Anaerolineales bacterium]